MLTAVVAGPPAATAAQPQPKCTAPPLPGQVVNVTLADLGSGTKSPSPRPYGAPAPHEMTAGTKMTLTVAPATVRAGTVSLRVTNKGTFAHQVVVLPLPTGQTVGQREVGSDMRVDEAGRLGEASNNCGAGTGGGISPASMGWTTLKLPPGRYELVCNFPGHYARGMYAELNVTG